MRKKIEQYYFDVSEKLGYSPDIQDKCIGYLYDAISEVNAARSYLHLDPDATDNNVQEKGYHDATLGLYNAQFWMSKVNIELTKTRSKAISYKVVAFISAIAILMVIGAYILHWFVIGESAETLNSRTILGVPVTVIFWSIVGSVTGMLLSAGNVYFNDELEVIGID